MKEHGQVVRLMEQEIQNLYLVVAVLEIENGKLRSELQQAREGRISALEKLDLIAGRDAEIAELKTKLGTKQAQVNRKDKALFKVRKQLKETLQKLVQAKEETAQLSIDISLWQVSRAVSSPLPRYRTAIIRFVYFISGLLRWFGGRNGAAPLAAGGPAASRPSEGAPQCM